MHIIFINSKIRRLCEDDKLAQKKLGEHMMKKLFQRMVEIRAAENLAVLKTLPAPRCHPLTDNRKGQYAVDLMHPKRLILLPICEGEFVEKLITDVVIVEITDYH